VQKYKNLDGLRGVAALVVVLCHYSNGFLPSLQGAVGAAHHTRADKIIATTPLHLFLAGNFAVCLFFVLSGFVLSIKFFHTKSVDALISSASRRYFRLMIPALISILATYIILRTGFVNSSATAAITGSSGWLATFWNFTPHIMDALYQGTIGVFFGNQDSYNTSLWTMHLELFGSFLIFMFLALFGNFRRRWLLYGTFGLILVKTYYLAFLLGVVISDIWATQPQLKSKLENSKISLTFLVSGLLLGSWYVPAVYHVFYSQFSLLGLENSYTGIAVEIVGAFMLIIAVLTNTSLTKFLETKPIQFLGRISFSLYLIHLIILSSLAATLFNYLIGHFAYLPSLLLTIVPSLSVTLVTAHFFTKWVDAPSITISKEFGNRLFFTTPSKPYKVRRRHILKVPSGTLSTEAVPSSAPVTE
jgi:peptidoglycan/LPS O-acetylase OafA/YrhL